MTCGHDERHLLENLTEAKALTCQSAQAVNVAFDLETSQSAVDNGKVHPAGRAGDLKLVKDSSVCLFLVALQKPRFKTATDVHVAERALVFSAC